MRHYYMVKIFRCILFESFISCSGAKRRGVDTRRTVLICRDSRPLAVIRRLNTNLNYVLHTLLLLLYNKDRKKLYIRIAHEIK